MLGDIYARQRLGFIASPLHRRVRSGGAAFGPLGGQGLTAVTQHFSRWLRLSFLMVALGFPLAADAQDHGHGPQPTWAVDVGVAGANIVAGALTAAATAAIRGEDMSEAFLKGAVGGGVVFAGKRLAVERFDGAGLLGRQLASVGSGMVVDGGRGRDLLSEVWLPVGPVWLQVRSEARRRIRVDLVDVGTLIWAGTRPELTFDVERSLSNGAPVFVAHDRRIVNAHATTIGGIVMLGVSNLDMAITQRHENVHVIQHDYLLQTLSRPLERWAWSWLTDRVIPIDFNVVPLFARPALVDMQESEAEVLEFR